MHGINLPKGPSFGTPGTDTVTTLNEVVRGKGFNPGPPGFPHILEKAPHQDLAMLGDKFVADIQEAAATVMDVLDKPFDATLKIEGPHRAIDDVASVATGVTRGYIEKLEK